MESEAMNFSDALNALKVGARVARIGWNGKGMFLFLVPGSVFRVIDMKTAQGYIVPWLASQADLLSDDWTVISVGK